MEEVIDGVNPFGRKHVGQARADTLDVLNGGGRFQHLKGC